MQGIPDPGVEGEAAACVVGGSPLVAKNGCPLAREVVGIVSADKELVDLASAFADLLFCQETVGFLKAGKASGDVDRHATKEGGIVAERGGWKTEGKQLGEDAFIYQVGGRGEIVDRGPKWNGGAEDTHVFLETNHDRSAPRPFMHGHQSLAVHRGHLLVVGLVLGNPGDVSGGPVAEVGYHAELLDRLRKGEALLRFDHEVLHGGVVLRSVGEALADPAHEGPVVVVVPAQSRSTLVGELPAALEEKEAVPGGGPEDAPSPYFLYEIFMIVLRFVSEEGKSEAVLALSLSVTPSAIATMAGKDGYDFIGEADGNDFPGPVHLHLAGEGGPLVAGRDGGFAIRNDPEETISLNIDHSCRFNRVTGQSSGIQVVHSIVTGGEHQLMEGVRTGHRDLVLAAPGKSGGSRGRSDGRWQVRYGDRRRGIPVVVLGVDLCRCCCECEAAAQRWDGFHGRIIQ